MWQALFQAQGFSWSAGSKERMTMAGGESDGLTAV